MHGPPPLLTDLAVVLGTAAIVSALFHRLRIPTILGYVIAGLVVGPHVPVPLVANLENVQTLSELGVILLMFTIGLEFNARKLLRAGPRSLLVVAIQGAAAFWGAFLVARAFGWGSLACVFTGAALCVSSTMIASRLLEASQPEPAVRESVFSVLVIQDLLAILLLTGLGTASGAGGVQASHLGLTLLRLFLFSGVLLVLGLLLLPRFVRWVADRQTGEALLVLSVGLCFSLAYASAHFGYSPALGAFLGGTLISESGRAERVEKLVHPLRDLFSAIFFVSVGMLMDPGPLPRLLGPILSLSALVLILTPLSVALAAMLGGRSFKVGFRTGILLAQVGEFSFIILGAGLVSGAIGKEVFTTAVAVSVLTLVGASALAPLSDRIATSLEARIPLPIHQRFEAYQAWMNGLDFRRTGTILPPRVRKPLILLILETGFLVAMLATSFRLWERWGLWLELREHWSHAQAATASWAGLITISSALGWIILRGSRRIAQRWMEIVGGAPTLSQRRMLQSAILLAVGLPALAALQPFLPGPFGWFLPLTLPAFLLGIFVWKGRGPAPR